MPGSTKSDGKHLFITTQMSGGKIFDMKHKLSCNITVLKSALKIACFLTVVFAIQSCITNDTKRKVNMDLFAGKWKVVQMQKKDNMELFDSKKNYFLELELGDKITVNAEDNRLSGNLNVFSNDSFKLENSVITDVCCNSDTADMLFNFFYFPVKYKMQGNKLTLSSEKGVLELKK